MSKLAEQISRFIVMSGWKVISGQKVIYNKWGKNEVFDELVIYYCE